MFYMLTEDVLDAVPAQRLASGIGEHGIGRLPVVLPQPMPISLLKYEETSFRCFCIASHCVT